jgi:hypothetical protein
MYCIKSIILLKTNGNLPLILYSKELEKSSYIIKGKQQSIEAIALIYKLRAITAKSVNSTSMPKAITLSQQCESVMR